MYGGLQSWLTPAANGFFLLVLVLIYSRGWYHLRAELPNAVSVWRFAAFLSAVLLIWGVLATPFAHLDHRSLTAHMVQHLVLMTLAAPMILLGEPVITLGHSLRCCYAARVATRLFHFASVPERERIFVFPVFCWIAGTVCAIGWHVPAVFALGMQSERWHEFEQATFLMAGLLFWWPMVRPWPHIRRRSHWLIPLYLFLATLPCDALSAFLTFCDRVVYSTYASGPKLFHGSALQDQEFAGAMMWVWVTFVYLIPAVVLTVQHLSAWEGKTGGVSVRGVSGFSEMKTWQ